MTELASTCRRAGVAMAAIALAAALIAAFPAPTSAAVTGSIVFIKDHNVWVMPADDPSAARQVTTDGTAASPYYTPTQDDTGVIMAVQHEGYGDIVRMTPDGTVLGERFRPAGLASDGTTQIHHLDLTPDGEVFSFSAAAYCEGSTDVACPVVDVAYADGRDSGAISNPNYEDDRATWYSSDAAVRIANRADSNGEVATYRLGDAAAQPWFGYCPPDEFGLDSVCFLNGAELAPSVDRLVMSVVGNAVDSRPARLRVFDVTAPPDAPPTLACTFDAPRPQASPQPQISAPAWSPDGTALLWTLGADNEFDEPPPDAGLWLATGFDAGCEQAFDTARLVVPGGSQADWSAAVFGAPVGPGPDPTEPGPDPTGPGPDPTGPGPDPTQPSGPFDGNPRTTTRINASDPIAAALQLSRSRFGDGGAARVVLSRDDTFPDSLAGAPLTFDGPLLFTLSALLHEGTRLEIERVLAPGGTVHVLGGTAAVSQAVEDELVAAGFVVDRLAGASRVETAIAVADRVRGLMPNVTRVALARAAGVEGNASAGWADSVTGGGWAAAAGVPILVTDSAAVHPAVAAWLAADQPSQTLLFGGTAALSQAVADAVPNPLRIAGAERAATAAAIATELWATPTTGLRRFAIIDGFHDDGWAFGLAAAGMAAAAGAPLLVVNGDLVPDPTAALVTGCHEVELVLVGSGNIVRHPAAVELDALDEATCG